MSMQYAHPFICDARIFTKCRNVWSTLAARYFSSANIAFCGSGDNFVISTLGSMIALLLKNNFERSAKYSLYPSGSLPLRGDGSTEHGRPEVARAQVVPFAKRRGGGRPLVHALTPATTPTSPDSKPHTRHAPAPHPSPRCTSR